MQSSPKVRQSNEAGVSYRRPLSHLPLGAAGGALAGPSLYGSLQVGHGAEVTVDRAVQARREHLPAANLPKLKTLAAGPRALAPAAGLPPGRRATGWTTCCRWSVGTFLPGELYLGWHSLPMQKSCTGSGRVCASQYMSCTSTPS